MAPVPPGFPLSEVDEFEHPIKARPTIRSG
jgi:hypothetical protein